MIKCKFHMAKSVTMISITFFTWDNFFLELVSYEQNYFIYKIKPVGQNN